MQQFGVYKVAEIRQNYDSSRSFLLLTYKLYHHLDKVGGVNKSNCLNVFLSLLKYAWKKNNYHCGLRHSKIALDTGLSRTTIYRTLMLLEKLNILKTIKGKSGKSYSINTAFLNTEKATMFKSETNVFKSETKYVSNTPILEEQYNSISNISNSKIDDIILKNRSSKDRLVDELIKHCTLEELKEDKKNVYYCGLAIADYDNKRNEEFVPPEKIINALKNVGGKKSNAFYRAKVAHNKKFNLDWKGNPKK
jgi:hypothetical protein